MVLELLLQLDRQFPRRISRVESTVIIQQQYPATPIEQLPRRQ
jgi:hypothetical protein